MIWFVIRFGNEFLFKLKFKWYTQNSPDKCTIFYFIIFHVKLLLWIGVDMDWNLYICNLTKHDWLHVNGQTHLFVWLVGQWHKCVSNDMCNNNSVKFHFVWWLEIELEFVELVFLKWWHAIQSIGIGHLIFVIWLGKLI